MVLKLLIDKIQSKYCKFCLGTAVAAFFLLNTSKIFKCVKFFSHKWFPKKLFVSIVSSNKDISSAIGKLRRNLEDKSVLGLDCEWVSIKSSRQHVALLQLAAPDGVCCLFRLCSMKTVPPELVELLEDKSILKVGVAVVTDARYLLSDYGVRCEGCLDLRHIAAQVGVEPRGLAYLSQHLLGLELDKDWRVRCSDWESETLTPLQIQYAAQDASVAIDIFEQLNHKKLCQNYNLYTRLFWSKKDYWRHSYNQWLGYIGLNFTNRCTTGSNSGGQVLSSRRTKALGDIVKRNYNMMRQKEHYSNVFLLAPDGEVLSTISDSRAAWYIEKELVDVVRDEPKTLKLKFEPSGRADRPDGYCTRPKENICVVCGSSTDLLRKNVVPNEYRKYFEEVLKNHSFHDILLLCWKCHARSNMNDQALREQLVLECDAPLGGGENSKVVEVPDLKAVKSAARALFTSGDVIPAQRKDYLKAVICNKLNISSHQLTSELLEELSTICSRTESEGYMAHGLKVVQHYASQGGVEVLERRWRQHFLDTMRPQYLPELWSVNYIRNS